VGSSGYGKSGIAIKPFAFASASAILAVAAHGTIYVDVKLVFLKLGGVFRSSSSAGLSAATGAVLQEAMAWRSTNATQAPKMID